MSPSRDRLSEAFGVDLVPGSEVSYYEQCGAELYEKIVASQERLAEQMREAGFIVHYGRADA